MSKSNNDEIESAKILIQENLLDEAKHTLFRLLTRIQDSDSHSLKITNDLLKKIEKIELAKIMSSNLKSKPAVRNEDSVSIISKLENDLQLNALKTTDQIPNSIQWHVNEVSTSTKELMDLAIAFFEMGCYTDSLRELVKAEKKIRIEDSFLGEIGIAVVAMRAQVLIKLGNAFSAKTYLEPILLEDDLPHENKIILYYTMGLAAQELNENSNAKGWFQKIAEHDPEFKDIQQRIRQLNNP